VLLAGDVKSLAPLLACSLGAGLIAVVSFIDDLRRLPNRTRFAVHSLGAALALGACGYWSGFVVPGLGAVELGIAGLAVCFVWIVGLTNAYNFMDGIDGLDGAQAVVAGVAWAGLGWITGSASVLLMGVFLAAASLGFLRHNWSPASVFIGDVGSAYIGYTLSVLPMLCLATSRVGDPTVLARIPVVAALVEWPFVFDAAFTFLRRLRRRENVFAAPRSHLYQRLVIAGGPHAQVALAYALLALVGALVGVAWVVGYVMDLMLVLVPLLAGGLLAYTTRAERLSGIGRVNRVRPGRHATPGSRM
jgi:UDP-N-acetylmuramyl pentapeptide phosphotransferase/UDP-N-acetylglucosamine-1-phosphate transferase